MTPRTPYQIHERDLERGWKPYPYAHLLQGAPMFTWTGWIASAVKRLRERLGI